MNRKSRLLSKPRRRRGRHSSHASTKGTPGRWGGRRWVGSVGAQESVGGWRKALAARVLLWWFGTLIGNTDMHYGNVSFFLSADRPLRVAPTYDMLPMLYRPDVEGRLPERPFNPHPPLPEAMAVWSRAIEMAVAYWGAVAGAASVSKECREIAGRNRETLFRHMRQFG